MSKQEQTSYFVYPHFTLAPFIAVVCWVGLSGSKYSQAILEVVFLTEDIKKQCKITILGEKNRTHIIKEASVSKFNKQKYVYKL